MSEEKATRCSQDECREFFTVDNPRAITLPFRFALGDGKTKGKVHEIGETGEYLCRKCSIKLRDGIREMGLRISGCLKGKDIDEQ